MSQASKVIGRFASILATIYSFESLAASDSKFDLTEQCGPSKNSDGWSRTNSGILQNGQFRSIREFTNKRNGGQQTEVISLTIKPDGVVFYKRTSDNNIRGYSEAIFNGQLNQNQKTITMNSTEGRGGDIYRDCSVKITLNSPMITAKTNSANPKPTEKIKNTPTNTDSKTAENNNLNQTTDQKQLDNELKQALVDAQKTKQEQDALKAQLEEQRQKLAAINSAAQDEIEKLKRQLADQEKIKSQNEDSRNKLSQSNISAQSEIERLKKQINEQEAKGSRLVTTDQFIVSAKSRVETLKMAATSNREIEVAMRSDYEVRIKSQVQQLRSRISLLTTAKATAANSDEIKFLQSQIDNLSTRSLEDEEAFKKLLLRSNELEANIRDLSNSIRVELDNTKQDLDEKRRQDFETISKSLVDIGVLIETTRQATKREMASLKSYTDTELTKLKQDQANLEKRLNTTNQILANLILPISERPEDWMMRVAAVPVQQQQFCRIVDRFYDDLDNVYKTRNDIKKNALFRDRHQDLAALLPGGAINSWIVRVIEVTQAPDGSAAVLLQPPCRAMLGSDACGSDQKKIRATIPPKSLMYRELSRVNTGDFVTISGKIIYAQESYADQPLPQYALYQAGKHCTDVSGAKSQDVFVTELTNLAVLK